MARPYSDDLRERAAAAVAAGRTCREVASLFGVSVSSVVKWSQRRRATGTAAAWPMGRQQPRRLEAHREWLLERLRSTPELTLRGLASELRERGVVVGHVAVWRVLKDAGFSFKKNAVRKRTGPPRHRPAPGPVEEIPEKA